MNNKKKLFLGIAGVGLLGLVGAGVGLLNNVNAVETKAYIPSSGEYTLYMYRNSDSKSAGWAAGGEDYYAYYWGDADGFVQLSATSVSDLYKFTIPSTATGAKFLRVKAGTTVDGGIWSSDDKWGESINIPTFGAMLGEANNTIDVGGKVSTEYWTGWSTTEYQTDLTAGDVYLRGTWSNGWGDVSKKMTYVSENVYKIEDVLLSKDDQIKAVSIAADYHVAWYDAADVVSESGCASFVDPNVVVSETGSYDVIVNISTKIYTVEVAVDEDLNEAVDFANDFKTAMATACPTKGGSASALSTQWSNFKTRYLDDGQTSAEARTYLKTLDNSTLNEFRERYDSILTDYYSTLSSYDFLNRADSLSLSARDTINGFANESSGTTFIVLTIGGTGLLTAGVFFLLRKRKEN